MRPKGQIIGKALTLKFSSLLSIFALVLWFAGSGPASADTDLTGLWLGTLQVGGTPLRIVLRVSRQENKTYSAKLDSPDQGVKDIPVRSFTLNESSVRAEIEAVGGVFEGKLFSGKDEIVGTWSQGGGSLPLTLKKTDFVSEPRRPQEPKRPFPYLEEEVSYPNPASNNRLAGTLTLPKRGGPFPVALLITGSGPQNRDEELLGHKPFLVLSDYLTRQGLAVLRVDDRGVGKSTGNFAQATTLDFASDVRAGIAYLKTRKEINPAKIGLIGHSEGGLIGPMVAADSPDVAFLVLMAGPGLNGEQIIYLQSRLIAQTAGTPAAVLATQQEIQKRMFSVLKSEPNPETAQQKLMTEWEMQISNAPADQKARLEAQTETIKTLFHSQNNAWFRFFLTYDPLLALRKVKCPVLALNGEKDLQVPPAQNLPLIEEALKTGNNKDALVKQLPGLNHLFQTSKTGSPSEYSAIEETLSPTALKLIGAWISERMLQP